MSKMSSAGWEIGWQEQESTSQLSYFANYQISDLLPILVASLTPRGPKFGITNFWGCSKMSSAGRKMGQQQQKSASQLSQFAKYHISTIFAHFGGHFDPPWAKIWYNQFLEMLKNVKNEFSRVENGVVGTKSSILALIVSEIPHFRPFGPFWQPF